MPELALEDVKILDLTQHIAGPYCTKLLADYGADVIKVERPGAGDSARSMGPFPGDVPHRERSGIFLHLNTNKRGITLDLKTQAGVNVVKELAAEVDILVENFRPGAMERFGLGYDVLHEVNPSLVMTSISNFGQTGPYRDFRSAEIMVYGMGGEMYSTGLDEREPLKLGVNVHLYQGGGTAAVATMGALFASRLQGLGQQVDVSLMETQIGSIDRRMSMLLTYQYTGDVLGRSPLRTAGYPNGVYPCADGYFQITGSRNYFPRAVRMMGTPEFLEDPRWHEPEAQSDPDLQEEFEPMFLMWTLERTKYEAWHTAQESRVLSAPLNTMEDLAHDPEFLRRGAFARIDHPETGPLDYPGRLFTMSESPWSIRRPAPMLGQHNGEVLAGLGYSSGDIVRLRALGVI